MNDGEEGRGEEKEGEVGEPEAKGHKKKKWKDMKKGTKGKRRIARAVEDHSRNTDRKMNLRISPKKESIPKNGLYERQKNEKELS